MGISVKIARVIAVALSLAALASCASPEQLARLREGQKNPATKELFANQTAQLASRITEKDLDACKARFSPASILGTDELAGPFRPSATLLCLKAPALWRYDTTLVANEIAFAAPVRRIGLSLRLPSEGAAPFWCIFKVGDGSAAILSSGQGLSSKRSDFAECSFPFDPLQPSR